MVWLSVTFVCHHLLTAHCRITFPLKLSYRFQEEDQSQNQNQDQSQSQSQDQDGEQGQSQAQSQGQDKGSSQDQDKNKDQGQDQNNNQTAGQIRPRKIDALTGNCGKFDSADTWRKRGDVYCDEEAKNPSFDQVTRPVFTNEFPSSVLLSIKNGNETRECLGVLIHNDAVLTANRCVDEGSTAVRASIGLSNNRNGLEQRFAWGYCRALNLQPFSKDLDNNAILILLRKPINYSSEIQPACFELIRNRNDKINCYATGIIKASGSNETLLQSIPFRSCPGGEEFKESKEDGHCYTRLPSDNVSIENIETIRGSGLYCVDKCNDSPIVYAVGIVAKGFGEFKGKPNAITVTRTRNFAFAYRPMIENCYELVEE